MSQKIDLEKGKFTPFLTEVHKPSEIRVEQGDVNINIKRGFKKGMDTTIAYFIMIQIIKTCFSKT